MGPLQPLAVGVMVNITESIIVPLLVIVCAGMLPVPLVLYPLRPALVAIQAKVVPAVVELKLTGVDVEALQIV